MRYEHFAQRGRVRVETIFSFCLYTRVADIKAGFMDAVKWFLIGRFVRNKCEIGHWRRVSIILCGNRRGGRLRWRLGANGIRKKKGAKNRLVLCPRVCTHILYLLSYDSKNAGDSCVVRVYLGGLHVSRKRFLFKISSSFSFSVVISR